MTDEHDAVVDPDARALETERLALAQAGADDHLDDIGEGGVFLAAVGEELDGLLRTSGDAFAARGRRIGMGWAALNGSRWMRTAEPRVLERVARQW
ncbi:hypothetical protein [Kitasatospora sp. NPDC091207]|uniref:hypothetical protein n=1 Tax=Kitasatospora sp. NPDC091207 TaxID=3364083 RepID=UPI0037F7A9CC